jgi:RNA polymerase sigma-B factor
MPQTQIAPSRAEGRPHVRRSEQLARRRRDEELFVRCRRDGDPSARAELVERFLPLARRLARRYERANEPLEDLVQVEVHDAVDRLSRDLGRSPSPQQLALLLDLPVEQVLEAPRGVGDDDPASMVDTMGETDPCFELVEERVSVRRGLRALPEQLGISQMHVSRLIRRSLELIRLVVDDG